MGASFSITQFNEYRLRIQVQDTPPKWEMQRQIKIRFLLSKSSQSNYESWGAEKPPTNCRPAVNLINSLLANQPMKRSWSMDVSSTCLLNGWWRNEQYLPWLIPPLIERCVILLQILAQLVLYKQFYLSQTGVERMLLLILRNLQVHPVIVTLSWISTVCNFHQILLDGAQMLLWKTKIHYEPNNSPLLTCQVPNELPDCCELPCL